MLQDLEVLPAGALDTRISQTVTESQGVKSEVCERDDQWDETFRDVCSRLPEKEKIWLQKSQNQKPFTSTQLFDNINPHIITYTDHGFQKFISTIDPVVSHINSFAAIINSFVQTQPEVSGFIWGSLYLLITLAGRAQKTLDLITDFLWRTSPDLALFQNWCRLFPKKDFKEVSQTVQLVYEEVIFLCVEAVKFLRRSPVANFFRVIVNPGMEAGFRKREVKIKALTAKVKQEVDSAHMHFVHHQLATIENVVVKLQNPQPMQTNPSPMRIIPHLRNDRFFGRLSVFKKMDEILLPSPAGRSQQKFALYGLGGSGKTQIALEYTYTRSQHYDIIIWILASSNEKIDQAFKQAAEQFGMNPKHSKDPGQAKDFVLQRLSSSTSSYLLVLDNIDDSSLTADIIPHGDCGAVITTSRDSNISEDLTPNNYQILEFSDEEGCGFLRSSLSTSVTVNAEGELRRINETFHGYPLALAVVAGFIRTYKCSLHEFWKIYEDNQSSTAISNLAIKDYHANLSTVWDISFSSLDDESRTILEIFALLDPDSVPYGYFTHGNVYQHIQWPRLRFLADPLKFFAALKNLRSQSLIRVNSNLRTISIHRYLQLSVRNRTYGNPQRQNQPFEEAVHLLAIIQPEFMNHSQHWNPQNWVGSEQYLPHIKALEGHFLENPSRFNSCAAKLAKLVYHGAVYQFERNHYQAASDTMANAKLILGRSSTVDVLLLSDCYRVEGRIFNESNQPIRTLESSEKAKLYADEAVAQTLISIHDSRLPRILTGWGNALNQLDRFDEALAMQLEAIKLCRDVPNDTSDATTIVQLNWAYVLLRLDDPKRASRILQTALEKDQDAPYVIYPLGNAYLAQGRIDEALAEHVRAHDIYVSWFGDQVAVVADSLYKIGEIMLFYKKNAPQALPFIRKAYAIYNDQARHYDNRGARARCSRLLGMALEASGNKEDTIYYLQKAWILKEELTGTKGSPDDVDAD